MTTDFTPIASTIGGVIIGLASAVMLAGNGRIAGISGILGELLQGGEKLGQGRPSSGEDRGWRACFIVGMLLGGVGLMWLLPESLPGSAVESLPVLVVSGLLVGFGTRMGGGCTSGHGICGISRLSTRSILATVMFMGTAIATVAIVRVLGGVG
jgi:uncharacterized membrane protein YedE/YeeE